MAKQARRMGGSQATPPSEFFHIFANSPMDSALFRRIMKVIPKDKPSCAVMTLVTLGGSPHDAYRIGRLMQMAFKEWYIHVPAVCASAGTLLVCAANGLIISAVSELGPLDAQILKSDELYARRSGLVVRSLFENLGSHAFDLHTSLVERIIEHSGGAIKYRTAAHVAGEMVVGLMRGLYDQMNPEQIGEDYRFLKVAEEYGKRLAEHSGLITEDALKKLVYDFPSHDFIIDFREAVRLFENVQVPSTLLQETLDDETRMPLSPLSPKERVVNGSWIKGSPLYHEDTTPRDGAQNDSATADESPSGGSPAPEVNGATSGQPPPGGASASSGAARPGGQARERKASKNAGEQGA